MANQVGTQLEKLEVTQREMTIVNKLAGIIAFNSDINAGFQDFVDELRKIVDVDWACIVLTMDVRAYFCALSSKIGSSWKVGDTVYIEGKDAAWLSAINEALTKGSLAEEDKLRTNENYRKQLLRSILYEPLLSDGDAFGALIIASARPKAYGEKELFLLNCIVDQIAMPVWKSVLLSKGMELLATMCQLTTLIDSDSKLDKVLARLARELRRLVSFDNLFITWIEGEKFTVQRILPKMGTAAGPGRTDTLKGSTIGRVLKRRETLIEHDLAKEKQFPLDFIGTKKVMRSLMHVPLISNGEVFAVVTLSSARPNTYGLIEQKILEQICVQIASTIKITHLYTLEKEKRLKLETEEEERLQFINVLAHELKTPTTAVIAAAGLLIEELSAKTQRPAVRLTQTIISAISKLEARLSDLLDIARVGFLEFKLNFDLLDVRATLENVINEVLPLANEKGQSISTDMPRFLPMVMADQRRLEQILVNLLTNAIKFSGDNGKIRIKVRHERDKVVVAVKDDGPGISVEEQERIFQPYYRIEADRQRFSGLGLGLALSKQLVEKHGGSLWVESVIGKGSIFSFSLPLLRELHS